MVPSGGVERGWLAVLLVIMELASARFNLKFFCVKVN